MNDPNDNQWNNSQNYNGNNPNQQVNNPQQNNYNPNQANDNVDPDSIITKLFYKRDRITNQYRIAKTNVISLVIFFLLFMLFIVSIFSEYGYLVFEDYVISFIMAFMFSILAFIIGWVIGKMLDDNNLKNYNAQHNPQMQYNPNSQQYYNQQNPNYQMNNQQGFNQQYPGQQQFNQQYPNNQQYNQQYTNQQYPGQQQYNQQYQNQQTNQMPNNMNMQKDNKEDISMNQADTTTQTKDTPIPDVKNDTTSKPQAEKTQTETVNDTQIKKYYESDNLGTIHDSMQKATAYWMGSRFQSEYKAPFTMYIFNNATDAENALLELPYIHKAEDTGKLICDEVLIYGYYKVNEDNYEALVCGKDLSYDMFTQAEDAFEKYGGKRKNNLEPDKTTEKVSKENKSENKDSSVKYRETINENQFTYECYDGDTKSDALEFLKTRTVTKRLYYICVYTPEGDYGKDIDGIYQM